MSGLLSKASLMKIPALCEPRSMYNIGSWGNFAVHNLHFVSQSLRTRVHATVCVLKEAVFKE